MVQPMVGKMMLPLYGGTPAVWNTCMVFFQAMLLLGYAYAHLSTKCLGQKRQAIVHIILMVIPLILLPVFIDIDSSPPETSNPIFWLLGQLLLTVGSPYFIIASLSPLLQRWFSLTSHRFSQDPYFLYASSNIGSFLALISYPIIFERLLSTIQQSKFWSFGYGFLILMVTACASFLWRGKQSDSNLNKKNSKSDNRKTHKTITVKQKLLWIFIAFVPSSLMLGVTGFITTNLAAIPLLWILPLALYLLTFVLAFARTKLIPHSLLIRITPFFIIPLAPTFFFELKFDLILLPLHLLMFFVVALICHDKLSKMRPPSADLTEYYLLISLGGALGGIFNAILSPLLFNRILEYPLAIFLACLIIPSTNLNKNRSEYLLDIFLPHALAAVNIAIIKCTQAFGIKLHPLLLFVIVFAPTALITFSFKDRAKRFATAFGVLLISMLLLSDVSKGDQIYISRNFYGVKRIFNDEETTIRCLIHGKTIHGSQFIDSTGHEPLSYYHREGPLGDVFRVFNESGADSAIGIVGLGVGSIASYSKTGQVFHFYEIDPVIVEIAQDQKYFNFLSSMEGNYKIIIGDGRLELLDAPNSLYEMIILDAFSSDSIPVHLLTKDALKLYLSKIKTNGLVVFHISNKFVDLKPLLANLAREFGLIGISKFDYAVKDERISGKKPSEYVVVGQPCLMIDKLIQSYDWEKIIPHSKIPIWTDKHSNIVNLLKF